MTGARTSQAAEPSTSDFGWKLPTGNTGKATKSRGRLDMLGRMLSDALEEARSAAPNVAVPIASTGRAAAGGRDYPDKLDATLLRDRLRVRARLA